MLLRHDKSVFTGAMTEFEDFFSQIDPTITWLFATPHGRLYSPLCYALFLITVKSGIGAAAFALVCEIIIRRQALPDCPNGGFLSNKRLLPDNFRICHVTFT